MTKTRLIHFILLLTCLIMIFPYHILAANYDVKFEVVSTSPIGATIRATINGSPKDVEMVVLSLEDIRNGVPPEKAKQQEIKYSEVNKITTETKEVSTPIMGEREINLDDVIARVSAPIEVGGESVVSQETIDYLSNVKVANTIVPAPIKGQKIQTLNIATTCISKANLIDTLADAPEDVKAILMDMPETVTDVVDYDVQEVEQEVKTHIIESREVSTSKTFDIAEPMTLEATVTSGGFYDKNKGWGASGVVALIIDGEYYYDISHSSWYSTAYKYRRTITIPTTNIDEDLSSFPVMLWLSSSSGTASALDVTSIFSELTTNGLKIAITNSDNSQQLYVEEASWNYVASPVTNSTAQLYVAVPTVSHTSSTTLNFYYDNTQSDNNAYVAVTGDATNYYGTGKVASHVWDSNFISVYHMNSASTSCYDSTNNQLIGTRSTVDAVGIASKGTSQNNTATNGISVAENAKLDPGSYLTVESWFNASGTGLANASLLARDTATYRYMLRVITNYSAPYFYLRTASGVSMVSLSHAANYYSDGNWHYMVGRYDKTQSAANRLKIWVDTETNTGTGYNEDVSAGSNGLSIFKWNSSTYLVGKQDETRLSNSARANEWVKATYYSEQDLLVTWGSETSISVPTVTTSAASSITSSSAYLNGTVTSANNGDLTVQGFKWDTSSHSSGDGYAYPPANDYNESATLSTPYTHQITSLSAGTTYYFRAYATNQAGNGWGSELTFTTESGVLAPTGFTATQTGLNEITLNWTLGTGSNMTVIRGITTGYPSNYTANYPIYTGSSNSTVLSGMEMTLNKYYFSAWGENLSVYSTDYATTSIGGTKMTELATNLASLSGNLVIIGEWLLILALIALAMWKHEKLLYLAFMIPIFIEGYRWFPSYHVLGIFVCIVGLYFLYQALRGFLAGDSE